MVAIGNRFILGTSSQTTTINITVNSSSGDINVRLTDFTLAAQGCGTATKDTYSLSGFTAAYRAISAKCRR